MTLGEKIQQLRKAPASRKNNWQNSSVFHVSLFLNGSWTMQFPKPVKLCCSASCFRYLPTNCSKTAVANAKPTRRGK